MLACSARCGRTEMRSCCRVARASYTETARDNTAITVAQIATTILVFISWPPRERRCCATSSHGPPAYGLQRPFARPAHLLLRPVPGAGALDRASSPDAGVAVACEEREAG